MEVDQATLLRAKVYAKQQYEKDMVRGSAVPAGLDAIGPPTWSRDAWEAFRTAYGRYPSIREGDLPNLQGCPEWAYELMGMRKPPVDVSTGSAGYTDPVGFDLANLKGRRRD